MREILFRGKSGDKFNKPIRLIELFGGSGTTLIACEQLNRKCYIMELDADGKNSQVLNQKKYKRA